MPNEQLQGRLRARATRKVLPTEREVLLARMLIQLCGTLDWTSQEESDLYNEVKELAETVLRRDGE